MILTLDVTAEPDGASVIPGRKAFSEAGGTIGRGPGEPGVDHWVLQHPRVSELHAETAKDTDTIFSGLLPKDFAEAYRAQLDRLKLHRRQRDP